jgi:hypothetical protein
LTVNDKGNSGRTHEPSLRELTAELDGIRGIFDEKIDRVREVADERDRRYEQRFVAMDEKTGLALTSSKEAVNKAEVAQEKRFDNTNEWRAAMQDRDRNQMPRVEIEQRFESLTSGLRWAAGITLTLILALLALYFKGH